MTDDATTREAAVDTPDAGEDGAPGAPGDERLKKSSEGTDEGEVLPAPPGYRPSYAFLFIVSFITLAADLGTKWWAVQRLEAKPITDPSAPRPLSLRKIEVIKDHLNLVLAKNHGGAWGILGDESEAIRRPFFLIISLAAIVFIVSLYRKLHPSQLALKWGLPLVLGGAIGNLVDRIRYGYVIDFIQVRFTPTFVWPTFNVADIAIVVGVGLMAIDMFVPRRAALDVTEKGAAGAKGSAG